MNRTNPKPFTKKPFVKRSTNRFDNYVLPPDRVPDEDLTQQLFLLVANGDFFEINKFLIENNMTVNGVDDDNNSILHHALANSNITKKEKTDLVNMLLNKGVPVSTFNKRNITPLHLACKAQLPEVVQRLTEMKADPNIKDSSGQTPLHYCVTPESVKCNNPAEELERLIPNDRTSIELEDSKLLAVTDQVGELVRANVQHMVTHVKKVLTSVDVNYDSKMEESLLKVREQVQKKVAEGIDKDDMEFDSLIRTEVGNINGILRNKLTNSLSDMGASGNDRGWAAEPGGDKLLPYEELSDGMNEFKLKYDAIKQNNLSSIGTLESDMDAIKRRLTASLDVLHNRFDNLLMSVNENLLTRMLRMSVTGLQGDPVIGWNSAAAAPPNPAIVGSRLLGNIINNMLIQKNGIGQNLAAQDAHGDAKFNHLHANPNGLRAGEILFHNPPPANARNGWRFNLKIVFSKKRFGNNRENPFYLSKEKVIDAMVEQVLRNVSGNVTGTYMQGPHPSTNRRIASMTELYTHIYNSMKYEDAGGNLTDGTGDARLLNPDVRDFATNRVTTDLGGRTFEDRPVERTYAVGRINLNDPDYVYKEETGPRRNESRKIITNKFTTLNRDVIAVPAAPPNPARIGYAVTPPNATTWTWFTAMRANIRRINDYIGTIKNLVTTSLSTDIFNAGINPRAVYGNLITAQYNLLNMLVHLSNMYRECNTDFRQKLNEFSDTDAAAVHSCFGNNFRLGAAFALSNVHAVAGAGQFSTIVTCDVESKAKYESDAPENRFPEVMSVTVDNLLRIYADKFRDRQEHIDNMLVSISALYTKAVEYINVLNTAIDGVNYAYGHKYTETYLNGAGVFNNSIANALGPIRDLIINRLEYFSSIPPEFRQFMGPDGNTLQQLKQDVAKRYVPYVANGHNNIPAFITGAGVPNPTTGFIGPNATAYGGIDDQRFNQPHTKHIIALGNDITVNGLPGNPNMMATLYAMPNMGAPAFGKNSNEILLSIVSESLDDHIQINKYAIFRDVLDRLQQSLAAGGNDAINNLKAALQTQLNMPNISNTIVLKTALNILNKLFKKMMTTIIGATSKNLVLRGVMQENPAGIDELVNRIKFITNIDASDNLFDGLKDEIRSMLSDLAANPGDVSLFAQATKNFVKMDRPTQFRVPSTSGNDDLCLEIDTNTLEVLIGTGVNANVKDSMGNTPIMTVIDIGHSEVLKIMLDRSRVSVMSMASRNSAGYTPISYSLKKIKDYSYAIDAERIIASASSKVQKEIFGKTKYPRILNRSEIIPYMVLYLLNHQLTLNEMGHYSPDGDRQWVFEDHNKLFNALGLNEDGLPLVHGADVPSMVKFSKNVNIMELIKVKQDEIDRLESERTRLNNRLADLDREINRLNAVATHQARYRVNALTQERNHVQNLTREIFVQGVGGAPDTGDLVSARQQLARLQQNDNMKMKDSAGVVIEAAALKNRLQADIAGYNERIDVVTKIYEHVFDRVNYDAGLPNDSKLYSVQADLNSYYTLWDHMLRRSDGKLGPVVDGTQLVQACINRLNTVDEKHITSLDMMTKYWNNVLTRQIDNYFNLPRIYKRHNDLLDALVDIYAHVIEHTLCANYYVVLFKLLVNYVTNKHPPQLAQGANPVAKRQAAATHVRNTMESILIQDDNNKLLKYIMKKMPRDMVRCILHIPRHDDDIVNRTNTKELLSEAVEIILQNPGIQIDRDEKFISNINTYIIPYFVDYFDLYVTESQNIVHRYLKQINSISSDMTIFKTLLEYAKKEEEVRGR